ncbi:MAG: primosomal protein N', partial [Desulfobacterales bacterium]|nr:primosomal protein N' [Desulfobacterales bacterium]
FRDPTGKEMFPSPIPAKLYDQQREVLAVLNAGLEKRAFSTCLLHGVTGSGKTEVYYRAVEQVIRRGRQAILMVPEIALAIYVEGMFRSRLGDRVAVFHSGLSEGERYDQWMRMARGEVDLVIGARSALFAPFPKLGLIIVDEEHDTSYKQEEGGARYQARDAAVMRGKMEKALVLLGSGTPSVQSFHNARTGRYQMLTMPDRIESRPLPEVEIIDMKGTAEGGEKDGILSPALKKAMESALGEGRQVMLFLNRRGFNRVCLCRSCGQPVRCPNCDIALIYHLGEDRFACHYCGFHSGPQTTCSSCSHEGMRAYGFGTERLEKELKELHPDKSIARMDRDSTRRKGAALQLLKRFIRQEIDILVGTQMITKGYDFPNVTLVGVIAADFMLGFPDFRAGERTFQVLSQVAGRAGRGDQRGRVIVQTFNPDHYAISAARDHDYETFFGKEKELREQLGYPPFSFLACLRLQGNDKGKTAETAQRLGEVMVGILKRWPRRGGKIRVLGPVEAPLSKLKGKYRWQIFVKGQGAALLHHFLGEVEGLSKGMIKGSGVNLVIDVDPYQML